MPNELKIVIDADVNQAIAGVQNLSKVISSDFTKATTAASAAASNLSSAVKGISDNQVKIDVNATGLADTAQRIKALEQQLINLEALKVTPDISSTQLALFESNIQRIKGEIASLKTSALVVPIGVDVVKAQADVNILSESIETLRAKAEAKKIFITTETDITKIAAYNKEIQSLEARVRQLQNVGKKGFELFVVPNQTIQSVKNLSSQVAAFGGGVKTFVAPAIEGFKQIPNSITPIITQLKALETQSKAAGASTSGAFTKAYSGLRTLANIIPGIGIGGLVGIAFQGITALTESIFGIGDAAKEAKSAVGSLNQVLSESGASVQGDVARVNALVKAATDTSNSFKIQTNAIAELKKINKDYFGDLVAGKSTYDEITKAANAYTDAIVNQAIVSGLSNAISKLSEELGNTLIKYNDLTKKANDARIALQKTTQEQATNVQGLTGQNQKVNLASNAYNSLQSELLKTGQEYGKISTRIKEFNSQIQAQVLNTLKITPPHIDDKKFKTETDDILARARLFVKEFGNTFVVPDLEISFFKDKKTVLKDAQKLLDDIKTGNLKIKLPVQTTFDLIPDNITPLTEAQLQELTKGFLQGIRVDAEIPLDVIFDPSLAPGSIDKINKKLDLRQQFKILGDIGLKEFDKIFKGIADTDFTGMNNGIKEATKRLQFMMEVATTLNQAIGQGLSSAFNAVFDSILEGKSVFKALGEAIKQLVVGTIKAIAQMLILKAITNLIFPGAGGVARGLGSGLINGAITGSANFGGVGGSPFSNIVQIVGAVNVSGQDLNIVLSRAQSSNGRF